jgi:hypothetical protein
MPGFLLDTDHLTLCERAVRRLRDEEWTDKAP